MRNIRYKKYIITFFIIIILFSIVAYSKTFNGEFQFDDDTSVLENTYVKGISRLLEFNLLEGIKRGIRPVTTVTFAINYRLDGIDVRWYHLTNFFIHTINGILIFYLTLLTMRSPRLPSHYYERSYVIALISVAIFLLHPIQTESISYISQRYESLASFFYLCSLIAYIRARLTPSLTLPHRGGGMGGGATSEHQTYKLKTLFWYLSSVICGLLALGSKEIAITIPVIILLYDFYFLEDRSFFRRIAGPGIFIFISFIAGIFILIGFNRGIDAGFSVRAFTPWEYLLTQFRVLATYIRLLFLPINQNLDYDFRVSKSLFEVDTAFSLLFILVLIVSAVVSFKRWRVGSFFMFWFFIILAPTSSVIPVIDVIFEHRAYLASAGIFAVIADVLSKLIISENPPIPPLFSPRRIRLSAEKGDVSEVFPSLEKRGRRDFTGEKSIYNKISVSIVIILMILLAIATFQRNRVWETKLSLWMDASLKSPMKSRVHNNLGNCYMLLRRHFNAIEEYKTAIALNKDNIEAYYNIGLNLDEMGLSNQAVYYYDIFYKNAPAQYNEQKKIVRERIDNYNKARGNIK